MLAPEKPIDLKLAVMPEHLYQPPILIATREAFNGTGSTLLLT
jgi:hypothetical protein